MKLIIQIPCYNEEKTLGLVLKDIPKSINGIDRIETQIIDDGSSDGTVEVARALGVNHIIRNTANRGLGRSFGMGMDNAIKAGADILVNTDGDNQYPSRYIAGLVAPIVLGDADIVLGDRQTARIAHFSPLKRLLQWLGTRVTIILSGERQLADAVSGFRAYSRQAMMELNVTSDFSYVLDTTVQSANKRLKTVSIPIETNPPTRPSRLFSNIFQHIRKSTVNLLRTFAFYKPLRVFFLVGFAISIVGSVPIFRFLYDVFWGSGGSGKIQSLIIGGILLSVGFNCFTLGVIGDLMSRNRKLIEGTLTRLKNMENTKS